MNPVSTFISEYNCNSHFHITPECVLHNCLLYSLGNNITPFFLFHSKIVFLNIFFRFVLQHWEGTISNLLRVCNKENTQKVTHQQGCCYKDHQKWSKENCRRGYANTIYRRAHSKFSKNFLETIFKTQLILLNFFLEIIILLSEYLLRIFFIFL